MDDITDANNDETREQIDDLIGQFGFEIKCWYSNNPTVGCDSGERKVLGVKWDLKEDQLLPSINIPKCNVTSKRQMLSAITEVWDPLGIYSGLLLTAKPVFQAVVRLQYTWDGVITNEDLLNNWKKWLHESRNCIEISVPRSVMPSKEYLQEYMTYELVGFCDGSSVGYGCVLYLKWVNKDESIIEVKFLGAKSKVAPIKGNTVPRNELWGALILSRLTWATMESLKRTEYLAQISQTKTTLHSDSTTVLSWVQSPAFKFKPFVKNKVVEIQSLVPSCTWKYIPSAKNTAADALSKGCSSKVLHDIIKGPDVLRERDSDKLEQPTVNTAEVDTEKIIVMNTAPLKVITPLLDVDKFNSWKKLLRVTGYVSKFSQRFREKFLEKKNEGTTDIHNDVINCHPDEEDVRSAENYWIKLAQSELNNFKSSIEALNPYIDECGITRITERIQNSEIVDHDRKHPIILHDTNKISFLILNDIHNDLFHPGHNRVIAESRKKYWIVKARKLAKSIGSKCTICRRWRNKHLSQIMSDLPWFRITPGGAPFENMSVDYFGPFNIKFGKRQQTKAYGVIFTCLTTRAIHLELATSLNTDSYLPAFHRFISVYGQPKFVRSDNGKNFRGAAREISDMIKNWRLNEKDIEKLGNFSAANEFKWRFSTPLASHHNGAVESLIKSVKQALRKVTNERVLSEEEYRTILAQIQNLINSRPLWPSNDGDLLQPPITPNDLLRPKGLNRVLSHLNESNQKLRYDYIQRLVDEWWRFWMLYFVPNLQARSKWSKLRHNLDCGDIVLLIDRDVNRGKWRMGIVEEVFRGTDGNVRSAKIKTQTGIYDRAITKLSLILAETEYET